LIIYSRWYCGSVLASTTDQKPNGIVEHGLFLDMADQVLVAHTEGVKILERSS